MNIDIDELGKFLIFISNKKYYFGHRKILGDDLIYFKTNKKIKKQDDDTPFPIGFHSNPIEYEMLSLSEVFEEYLKEINNGLGK